MPSMDQEDAKSSEDSRLFSCFLHSNFSETDYCVTHTHAHLYIYIYAYIKNSTDVSILE